MEELQLTKQELGEIQQAGRIMGATTDSVSAKLLLERALDNVTRKKSRFLNNVFTIISGRSKRNARS